MESLALMLLAQWQLDPGWLPAIAALLLGLVGCVILLRGRSGLKGTTLLAPWGWCFVAWVALFGSEVAIGTLHGLQIPVNDEQWRYLAAMGLFCPQLSQIGAKRSQTLLWQLVVVLFWVILCLPVWRAWFSAGTGHMNPGPLWGTFLAVLILAGVLNNGPTRFGCTALCLASAQVLMTYSYLPGTGLDLTSSGVLASMVMLVVGMMMVLLGWPTRPETMRAEDRAWIDFRDSYGGFWAARVMYRVNESAVRFDWGLWLGWNGFSQVEIVGSHPDYQDEVRHALVSCLRRLLGDFVDQQWLDARLPRPTQQKKGLEDLEA
ncbi:hypothetical protein AB1L30_08405 [Bremerella sp. JC817]|uniref:hypothetical protein n=1 Tax=Bremerella sp. JC817 TaxID=3231756 RepID=UPI00345A4F64